jgi:hypothetical protein
MDNETQARCSALKDVLDLIDEVWFKYFNCGEHSHHNILCSLLNN